MKIVLEPGDRLTRVRCATRPCKISKSLFLNVAMANHFERPLPGRTLLNDLLEAHNIIKNVSATMS